MTRILLIVQVSVIYPKTAVDRAIFVLLCLLAGLSAEAQWVRKADALRKRSEVTSVVYNNKLYAFIGFSNSSLDVEPSSEVYDPVTDTWTLLAPIPAGKAVTHQGVALVDNTVWHIGGRVGKNPGPLTNEIWIYNIGTNSWSAGPPLKDPATDAPLLWGGCGAVLLGRTLHIYGGFVVNPCNNDQDRYHLTLDVDQWLTTGVATWKNDRKPLPMKRCHFATTVLGGKVYAMGGQFGHDCGEQDHGFSHVYDPATDIWTQLTSFPAPRSHAEGGVFPMDGKIYVVAGQQANSANTNKVSVFDPAGNNGAGSWAEDPALNLPNSYEGVSAKAIGSAIIFSHGGLNNSSNTQNLTYVRTVARNPVYQFGFSAPCLNLSVKPGQATNAKNLLFTYDDPRAYALTSDASWLTITKNGTGTAIPGGVDVSIAVNAAGLTPGTYTGRILATATGAGSTYAPVSFCVNLTVAETIPLSTVRINAGGGPTTVNGINWSGCPAVGSCNGYVNGGNPYTQQPLPAITGVTAPTNESMMQTEWTGGQTTNIPVGYVAFSYAIPVVNGDYRVRLHFVELNKNGVGLRKFDVNIEEGIRELTNFDIFAEAGGLNKAIFRDFVVNVTDGVLKIDFIRQVENAKISAIEILPATSSPPPPPAATTVRINAGGKDFTASGSRPFASDTYFAGGSTYAVSGTTDLTNTTDDALYQTERWGAFTYNVPVTNGSYTVVLHFAEIYLGVSGSGTRKFNVDIEGIRKLTEYNIAQKAGGALKAVQETFSVNVSDGTLNIAFLKGSADNPKVSAIEIVPETAAASQSLAPTPGAASNAGVYRLSADGEADPQPMQVRYYPNPFVQSFTVQVLSKETTPVPLLLYDAHGRTVLQLDDVQPEQTIRLGQQVVPGLYLLQIGTGRQATRHKLIKIP